MHGLCISLAFFFPYSLPPLFKFPAMRGNTSASSTTTRTFSFPPDSIQRQKRLESRRFGDEHDAQLHAPNARAADGRRGQA
jgi:hypothetical protein